jgi:hypothetical protein
MPKRSSKSEPESKRPGTARASGSATATRTVAKRPLTATPDDSSVSAQEKNPAAVALGKLGGAKGGKARAESLSPEERRAIALRAAKARWDQ